MNASAAENLSILFVDDQPVLLKMLKCFFELKAPHWTIRYANSGVEALEKIAERPPEVVVSDIEMPGMDGRKLLQIVKERYPSLFRVILSGDCNAFSVKSSVGIAHQRLNKPVNMEELIKTLELSQSLYNRIRDPGLQNLISEFEDLPIPRESYFKVNAMINLPDVEMEEVAQEIRKDVMISAHILRLVNSAFIGRGSRVDDIQEAVMTLGFNHLRSLMLMVGLMVERNEARDTFLDIDAFVRHSLMVATESRRIAKKLGFDRKDQETSFTAGLLHNIGKVVMVDIHREYYTQKSVTESAFTPFMQIEEDGVAAYQHPLVGAALLAVWGIPGTIVNAVAHHHCPEELNQVEGNFSLPVHLAEGIINFQHNKDSSDSLFDSGMIHTAFIDELGIREKIEDHLMELL